MREQLVTRQVTVKISDGLVVTGAVIAVDDAGIWIQLASSSAAPPGVPEGIQSAVLFAPFAQMLWAVTSIAPNEHTRHPAL